MEECELCGAQTKSAYIVNVEDVELRVCAKCAQGKRVISNPGYKLETGKKTTRPKRDEDLPLVEDYGKVIRAARDRIDLPMKVLAEMLNEKETLLSRVEQQSTLPTIKLTKKLEKALGIKLIDVAADADTSSTSSAKKSGITLGDFVNPK
jgi:putative transcription factor